MAISVVQTATAFSLSGTAWSATFGSNVTANNTIVLAVLTFNSTNVVISTSSPLFGGASVTGSSKLAEVQSAYSGFTTYAALWLLPVVSGGSATTGITVTNGTNNNQTGLIAWEVAGLGTTPALDQSSTSSGASTSATSGTTPATTNASDIVVGALVGLDGLTGTPTSPSGGYTNTAIFAAQSASVGGYQVQTVAGGTYTYANANAGTDQWAGAVAAITGPATGTNANAAVAAASGAGNAIGDSVTLHMTIRGS